mgnify:FL=1
MKKLIFIFIFLTSCSLTSSNEVETIPIVELTYQNLDGEFVSEDLTNKETIIVFWADYWGICRQELPVLEANLDNLLKNYDVIALAHSDLDSTNYWVNNNLNGILQIGISTNEIRDEYKVIGQPLTIILNTDGEIIFREYGYIPTNDF